MILRSFPELDLVNPLTPMVNQLKTLLDTAQVQVAQANNPSGSSTPVGKVPAQGGTYVDIPESRDRRWEAQVVEPSLALWAEL